MHFEYFLIAVDVLSYLLLQLDFGVLFSPAEAVLSYSWPVFLLLYVVLHLISAVCLKVPYVGKWAFCKNSQSSYRVK